MQTDISMDVKTMKRTLFLIMLFVGCLLSKLIYAENASYVKGEFSKKVQKVCPQLNYLDLTGRTETPLSRSITKSSMSNAISSSCI